MSVLGFPEELNFQSLKSMYPSRKTEYRKAPMNSQTFTAAGQDIQLVLSKMENTFYDPNTLCVNFSVDYSGITAGTVGTNGSFLLGNAYSHFSRQVVRPISGQPIETIDNPSLLANAIFSMTMDSFEKISLSSTMGFCADPVTVCSNLGALIDNDLTINNESQSYSIPLIGCLNTAKLIPAFISDIEIDLTLNTLSNFIVSITPGTANTFATGYTIRNVELVCEAITLEASGMQQILAMFPGAFKLKSQSYLYGSSSLSSAATQGTYDITYSHSLNSLKQFIWWSSPSGVWEGNYAGVCPNLTSWQLILGSSSYPMQPVKADRPSECFMQNQKSFGSLYSTSHSGSSNRYTFAKASTIGGGKGFASDGATPPVLTAIGEYAPYVPRSAVDTYAKATTVKNAHKWYQALDLEIINSLKDTLYTGISTKGSTNTLRLNVGQTLAAVSHAVHFFSCFDVILEFDYANQMINVIQ
jgi:hypothetical protein